MGKSAVIAAKQIENSILLIRGEKVMIDSDLAEMYGVQTEVLNQAVKRNIKRFPADFMFQLSKEENEHLRTQIVILEKGKILRSQIVISRKNRNLRSKIAISSVIHGGRRYLPYAFTEQGVAMLSSVLNSDRAVAVNIQIMRTFVQLREMLSSNSRLALKLAELEKKYDSQFQDVFSAIRQLMNQEIVIPKNRRIGY